MTNQTESQKYANGRSGFGSANYASAAWRAGDAERQRIQHEEFANRQNQSASDTSDDGTGGLVFLALIISGVVAAIGYKIFGTSTAGWIGFGIGFGFSLLIPGIREAVFYVVLGISMLALLVGGVFFIFDTFSGDSANNQQASASKPALNTRQEAVALANKILAEESAKLKELNANSVPEIEKGEEYRRNMEDPSYNCRLCKSLVESGQGLDGNKYNPDDKGKMAQIWKTCHTEYALNTCKSMHSISWKL